MNLNANLSEQVKVVEGLLGVVPSTSTPDYVSLKNYERCMVLIQVKNATTVTGSAITLKQATAVAGTGEKALAFTTYYSNIDTGAADVLASATATSNTFTTNSTNSKNLMYVIEVKAEDLDVNNGFDCLRAGTGDATAATVSVTYFLFGSKFPTTTAAITD
jgi:hypothetical protein